MAGVSEHAGDSSLDLKTSWETAEIISAWFSKQQDIILVAGIAAYHPCGQGRSYSISLASLVILVSIPGVDSRIADKSEISVWFFWVKTATK